MAQTPKQNFAIYTKKTPQYRAKTETRSNKTQVMRQIKCVASLVWHTMPRRMTSLSDTYWINFALTTPLPSVKNPHQCTILGLKTFTYPFWPKMPWKGLIFHNLFQSAKHAQPLFSQKCFEEAKFSTWSSFHSKETLKKDNLVIFMYAGPQQLD